MTASITFGPRHPAYMAGRAWAENPTRGGCPYERGTDDYAMWQMAVADYGIWMRATGRSEIEDVVE